jgi:ferredoxin
MGRDLPAEDPLFRMQKDLKRALQKKPEDIKWGMVIDIAKCIGCHACTIACVAENKLPPGVVYRTAGMFGRIELWIFPLFNSRIAIFLMNTNTPKWILRREFIFRNHIFSH